MQAGFSKTGNVILRLAVKLFLQGISSLGELIMS
jgi:hypothetical protein